MSQDLFSRDLPADALSGNLCRPSLSDVPASSLSQALSFRCQTIPHFHPAPSLCCQAMTAYLYPTPSPCCQAMVSFLPATPRSSQWQQYYRRKRKAVPTVVPQPFPTGPGTQTKWPWDVPAWPGAEDPAASGPYIGGSGGTALRSSPHPSNPAPSSPWDTACIRNRFPGLPSGKALPNNRPPGIRPLPASRPDTGWKAYGHRPESHRKAQSLSLSHASCHPPSAFSAILLFLLHIQNHNRSEKSHFCTIFH